MIRTLISLHTLSSGIIERPLLLVAQLFTLLHRLLQLHVGILYPIMLRHVGEDVVEQNIADHMPIINIDILQCWDGGLATTGLVHVA
jgi:hypothetical protein